MIVVVEFRVFKVVVHNRYRQFAINFLGESMNKLNMFATCNIHNFVKVSSGILFTLGLYQPQKYGSVSLPKTTNINNWLPGFKKNTMCETHGNMCSIRLTSNFNRVDYPCFFDYLWLNLCYFIQRGCFMKNKRFVFALWPAL